MDERCLDHLPRGQLCLRGGGAHPLAVPGRPGSREAPMIGPQADDPSEPVVTCRFCKGDVINTALGREYHMNTCPKLIKHNFRLVKKGA